MKKQKSYSAAVFALFLILCPGIHLLAQSEWDIVKPSTLTVVVTSNISSIACENDGFSQKEKLVFTANSTATAMSGKIVMPVRDLNCRNFIYNTNMRKTLKADQYKNLQIRFLQVKERLNFSTAFDELHPVKVEITLAGVAKNYEIPIRFQNSGKGKLTLSGATVFKMSDFKMEPTLIGKVVEVEDDFAVKFNLLLEQ